MTLLISICILYPTAWLMAQLLGQSVKLSIKSDAMW